MKTFPPQKLRPLTISALNQIPQIKHAFFTRQGGISAGLYASLNCGFSSGDKISNIRENLTKGGSLKGGMEELQSAMMLPMLLQQILGE